MARDRRRDRSAAAAEVGMSEKKKRKKGISATALTLKECKSRGWIAQTVEQTIPHTFIKRDLFGAIDIIAVTERGILGIQATSAPNHAARANKALEEPRLQAWLKAGGLFGVWSWSKKGRLWELREEEAVLRGEEWQPE